MIKWKRPRGFDIECEKICIALNKLPGIQTTESCCGHGEDPFYIWFDVIDYQLSGLRTLAYCIMYYAPPEWKVELQYYSGGPESFLLIGPVGDFEGANSLAKVLDKYRKKIKLPFRTLNLKTNKMQDCD